MVSQFQAIGGCNHHFPWWSGCIAFVLFVIVYTMTNCLSLCTQCATQPKLKSLHEMFTKRIPAYALLWGRIMREKMVWCGVKEARKIGYDLVAGEWLTNLDCFALYQSYANDLNSIREVPQEKAKQTMSSQGLNAHVISYRSMSIGNVLLQWQQR